MALVQIYFLPDPSLSSVPFAAFKVKDDGINESNSSHWSRERLGSERDGRQRHQLLIELGPVAQAPSLRTLVLAKHQWNRIQEDEKKEDDEGSNQVRVEANRQASNAHAWMDARIEDSNETAIDSRS